MCFRDNITVLNLKLKIFYSFRHYGDLGNIEEQNGQATVDIKDDFIELYGEYNVDRLSLVECTNTLNFPKGCF